jgi:integrase
MPLTLIKPKEGRTPYWRVRGTLHGTYLDRSTETADRREAERIRKGWEKQILSGVISGTPDLTFKDAAMNYALSKGERLYPQKLVAYFGANQTLKGLDQAAVDRAAFDLHPNGSSATRNRQVYTPVMAILKHAKMPVPITRPTGAIGKARTRFLTIEEFDRLEEETAKHDPEFAALLMLMAYTGLRLGEALSLRRCDLNLQKREVLCGKTKNGDPRMVHLPPRVIVALQNAKGSPRHDRIFRWAKGGMFYVYAERLYARAGVDHGGAPFHILRHSYGKWMTQLGADLVGTGVWKSPTAARVYQHFVVSEEAAKADLLPGARRTK